MDRIYHVLTIIQDGTRSPKKLFIKATKQFKNNLVEYQLFLNELEAAGYITFLGGKDKPAYGDIILQKKGRLYLKRNKSEKETVNPSAIKPNHEKYNLGDYALMQVYLSISGEGEGVTNTNKDEAAGKFGFKGQKFYLEYNKYSKSAQRTGTSTEREDNGKKKRFEKVLKLLAKYPEALERANSEYEEFMASYNKIY